MFSMMMIMSTTVTVLSKNLSKLTLLRYLIVMIVSQINSVLSYRLNIFTIGHGYAFNHSHVIRLLATYPGYK